MTHRHAVVLLCVVGVVLVSPAIVAQETATPTANATTESDDAGMGTQLTAFAQSSSAAANDSIENGMWRAEFDQANASQRAQLVTNRTGTLEQRLAQLQEQNETIQAEYENGTLPETAYVAQQSQLSARITALQTAINDTDAAAAEAGVNDSRLETLRQNASELTGPQVAGVARGLAGGPPTHAGGPPNETGPPGNETGPSNATGPPNETGPPGNETGPSNETGSSGNVTAPGTNSNQTSDSGTNGTSASDNTSSSDDTSGSGSSGGSDSGGNSGGPENPGSGGADGRDN